MTDPLINEIDRLISFWVTHDCIECKTKKDDRFPSRAFPEIFKFLNERNALAGIDLEQPHPKEKDK